MELGMGQEGADVKPSRRILGGMKRRSILLIGLILVALSSCDGDPAPSSKGATSTTSDSEEELFQFAAQHLPDDRLQAVAPAGFDVTDIKRYGQDRNKADWITVGVRMDGPLAFSRAIYYVHPSESAAQEMFTRQAEITRQDWNSLKDGTFVHGPIAKPFPVDAAIPTLCGIRADSLYWCHGVRGRIYLLIQSSAGDDPSRPRTVSPSTRDEAIALTKAFATYLHEELPSN